MKFIKSGKNIRITDLNVSVDVRNFLCCQIPMTIAFMKHDIELHTLIIGERTVDFIEVNGKQISRNNCLKLIYKLAGDGIPEFVIDSNIINNTKYELFECLKYSKSFIEKYRIDGVIDYQENLLSIIVKNNSSGKKTDDIYFWNNEGTANDNVTYCFSSDSVKLYPKAPSAHNIEFFLFGPNK